MEGLLYAHGYGEISRSLLLGIRLTGRHLEEALEEVGWTLR